MQLSLVRPTQAALRGGVLVIALCASGCAVADTVVEQMAAEVLGEPEVTREPGQRPPSSGDTRQADAGQPHAQQPAAPPTSPPNQGDTAANGAHLYQQMMEEYEEVMQMEPASPQGSLAQQAQDEPELMVDPEILIPHWEPTGETCPSCHAPLGSDAPFCGECFYELDG